jgi:hypothetical protein
LLTRIQKWLIFVIQHNNLLLSNSYHLKHTPTLMKSTSTHHFLIAIVISCFISITAYSQNVSVSGAVIGNGSYPDLGAAFTAINSGAQTGSTIVVSILASTTEPVTAVLNQGTWSTLSVIPVGGAPKSITGAIAGPLIDFNGADRVLVDGLNSSGNSLTVNNTSNTTASTIRFINDAHVISVQNATVLGANTSTTSGTIVFSTASATGNDSITINACTIDASAPNFPVNGIYSSGTTTSGMENHFVTINGCNIANYYSAGNVTCGVLVAGGNTAWTIQGNRLFQSATRRHTTSNTHFGINITSGSGYFITGNIIGFANASGTGTTNIVGNSVDLTGTFPSAYTTTGTANATRYVAINCAFTAGGQMSEIQNNTIAGFALYTSSGATTTNGIFCGIAVTSGNVNIGTTTGNTIGSATGTGSIYTACTTTGGIIAGIYVASVNYVTIRNNMIGALDAMGTTATISGGINGINIASGVSDYDVSGNTIGNTTLPNLRMGNLMTGGNHSNVGTTFTVASGLAQFNGILSSKTGTGAIGTNIIRNATLNSSNATTSIRGITASGSPVINGNNINNLACATTAVAVTSTLLAGMGIFLNSISTVGAVVSNNTIYSLSLTNTTTNGTNITGVAIYCSSTDLFNNKIYDINNASTSTAAATPGTASGFFLRQPAGTINIYNNMVSLGNGQTTNTAYNGIWQQNSVVAYTLNVYYNTINIEGTAASGAQPSFCLNRGSYSTVQVVTPTTTVNNIFTNTRTGGTGKHYAIGNNYLAPATNVGWGTNASNYNVLNAAAATVGYWGGDQTFAGWQAASACDANSLSAIPVTYVNTVTGDLHLNFGVTPTQIESGGTVIATITTDIDGQARPGPVPSANGGGFSPDMGADEFDGVPLDAAPPTITYTALTFTCATTDRTFTATLTDISGVPTTGPLQPRVYFRKNAAAWNSAQGTFVSGTPQNGTWSFTISTATMGGLAVGDVVSYYVIAQDIVTPTANIRSNPAAGLVASDVNTVTTPPTTPNSYSISNTLSGTFTVGASGTYPTLTAAVAAYNASCLGGPVVFSLIDATYPAETFPITVLANPDASSINTLTIQPATGNTATLTGSTTTGIIILNGADYVTINGSNSSTVNSVCPLVSATRDLTISNTNASTAAAVVWLSTTLSLDAVTNCTVQNCIIAGSGSATTLVALGSGGPGIGTSGTSNNFISFINNDIRACQYGVFSGGLNAATKNQTVVVNQNFMNNAAPNNIGLSGIVVNLTDNITISGNTVGNILNTASADIAAINVGFSPVGGFLATTVGIPDGASNVTITHNTIGSVEQTGTFSAIGIGIGNTISGTNLIANNMVYGVIGNATPGDIVAGIVLGGGTATTNVYHNTVSMQGNISGASAATATSACLAIVSPTVSPLDMQNNIFSNTQAGNASATIRFATIALGYSSTVGNYTSLISNNNDLYSTGSGPGSYHVGITGGVTGGTSRTTLANWQTETGRDINSSNVPATFVSAIDLHAVVGSNPGIEDAGTPLVAVTADFDCAVRSTCTPDIGAHEFGTPREIDVEGNSIAITDGDNTPDPTDLTDFGIQSVCNGTLVNTFTIQNPGTTDLTLSSVTITGPNAADFTVTTSPATTITAGGSTTFTVTFDPSAAGAHNATISINTNDCDEAIFDFAVLGTGTQVAASASAQTNVTCNGGNDGSATVATTGGIGPITYLWAPSGGTGSTASGLIAGSYTVTVSDVNGCTATQSFSITEPPVLVVSASAAPTTVCAGDPVTLTGSGASTYSWMPGPLNGTVVIDMPVVTTTYTVTGTDGNGCIATATVSVNVNPLPPVVANATATAVCDGSPVTLSGSGATSYTWSGSVTDNVAFTPIATDTYTVTGTDGNGCMNTDMVTVTVNPLPAVVANATATAICDGSPVTLSGSGAATYTWTGSVTDNVAFTPLVTDTYTVTGTDANGCVNTDNITVTVNTLPAVVANATATTVCAGSPVTLTGSGATSYTWTGAVTDNVAFNPAVTDTYTVTGTDGNGCTNTDNITITVNPLPTVTVAVPQNAVCVDDGNLTLTGGSPAGGTWSGTNVTGSIFDPTTVGNFTITYTYTDGNGCTNSATDGIEVNACVGIITTGTAVDIAVYPNPNNGAFTIVIPAVYSEGVLQITDALGQVISSENIAPNQGVVTKQVSLEAYSNGVYFVRFVTSSSSVTQKVILQR